VASFFETRLAATVFVHGGLTTPVGRGHRRGVEKNNDADLPFSTSHVLPFVGFWEASKI
jgi:hypothetical protein